MKAKLKFPMKMLTDNYGFEKRRESVGICVICKTEHFRDNTEDWVYHDSVGVVCKKHPGVMNWYNALIDVATEMLRKQGIVFHDYTEDYIKKLHTSESLKEE
jgi:hypothetical protein